MGDTSLNITLSSPAPETVDAMFLEQEDYSDYLGKVTKAAMIQSILGFIFPETSVTLPNNCGGADGIFETIIFAYFYEENLTYDIGTSQGLLGMGVVESLDYVEYLNISLKEEVNFSYPSRQLKILEWEGAAYNKRGEVIPYPDYTVDSKGLKFDSEVYGSLKVRYNVIRHRYVLTVESLQLSDPGVIENKYQAVVYARWDGGVTWLEVEAPHGFEDFDGRCGSGGTTVQPPEEPDSPPFASPTNKDIYIDYCTQEPVSYRVT